MTQRKEAAVEAHRKYVLDRVYKLCMAEAAGRVSEAQGHYDRLRGYCDGAGIDFDNALRGAARHHRDRACGVLDSAAFANRV